MMITGIGSFPFTDLDEAIDLIFATCAEIPFWPQLPNRSPQENMYTTFLESVPCATWDESGGGAFMDTEETEGIEQFYEKIEPMTYRPWPFPTKWRPASTAFWKDSKK